MFTKMKKYIQSETSAGILVALTLPIVIGVVGCKSDYELGLDTPPTLVSPTPNLDLEPATPPSIHITPTVELGAFEVGEWHPSLRVEPPVADFGELFNACTKQVELTVINDGTVPQDITGVYVLEEPDVMGINHYSDLITLEPNGSGTIRIDASGLMVGLEDSELWIEASEGASPAAKVPIVGEVIIGLADAEDHYIQTPAHKVDILWVIDNSGSMSDNQKTLAANFESFIETFAHLDIEYHMGLISTDMQNPSQSGRMLGEFADGRHFIDWTMREQGLEQFTRAIVALGQGGSGSEQGLWAQDTSLSYPLSDNWNEGFLRDDAFLSIVFVSDEEDQSPGSPDSSVPSEDYYLDRLVALKGGYENVVCNSIVSFTQPQGYVQLSMATGGYVYPIHGDYDEFLVDISFVSAGYQSTFPLTQMLAVDSPLDVYQNGVLIPQAPETWAYDPSRNAVVFSASSLPPDDAKVDLHYKVGLPCEAMP